LGGFLTNIIFDDVVKQKNVIEINFLTKINYELFEGINIIAVIFNENKDKWINFNIDSQYVLKLKNNDKIFVADIDNWSYKLPSTKYNIGGAKLNDLLVED